MMASKKQLCKTPKAPSDKIKLRKRASRESRIKKVSVKKFS
jgi:hypothetical protein